MNAEPAFPAAKLDLVEAWRAFHRLIADKEDTRHVFDFIRAVNGRSGEPAFRRFIQSDYGRALIEDRRTGKPILVEQGAGDNFLEEQLMPDKLKAACAAAGVSLTLNIRPGYDHSYFFIASFIDEHIAYHARALAN